MAMDNKEQIEEIKKYRQHLSSLVGHEIENNAAAFIWINKYAEKWRLTHPPQQPCTQ
jgi:hypothetical protein